MRQNYYCPNCGTPVTCGARFCTGCGVNFQWIAPSELEQCSPISYKLPSSDQHNLTDREQSLLESPLQQGTDHEPNICHSEKNDNTKADAKASQFKAEVAKLLESFLDKNPGCHKV